MHQLKYHMHLEVSHACDRPGRAFVVQAFTTKGKFVKMFGKRGKKPGEIKWSIGITLDAGVCQ